MDHLALKRWQDRQQFHLRKGHAVLHAGKGKFINTPGFKIDIGQSAYVANRMESSGTRQKFKYLQAHIFDDLRHDDLSSS